MQCKTVKCSTRRWSAVQDSEVQCIGASHSIPVWLGGAADTSLFHGATGATLHSTHTIIVTLSTCADEITKTKKSHKIKWRKKIGFVSCVTCHISCVTCHMWPMPTVPAKDASPAMHSMLVRQDRHVCLGEPAYHQRKNIARIAKRCPSKFSLVVNMLKLFLLKKITITTVTITTVTITTVTITTVTITTVTITTITITKSQEKKCQSKKFSIKKFSLEKFSLEFFHLKNFHLKNFHSKHFTQKISLEKFHSKNFTRKILREKFHSKNFTRKNSLEKFC